MKRTPPAGSATVYIFSGSKVIAEYASGAAPNSPSSEYIYSAGQLVATLAGSATTYHHPDQLSTRISTDSNGNTARAFGHYPFGETWYETGTASKWKFTSYERDAESLNDYAFARTYVNRLARFSSTDPLTGSLDNPQATNRYAYAINDPINLNDSLGLGLCPPYTICVDAWGHPWPSGGGVTVGGGSGGVTGGGGGNPKTIEQSGPGDGGNSSGDRSNPYVDRKALADCISTLFPGVTLADFEESTPGVKGSFTGFGPDLRTNHGNTGPIVVVNDAATYNAAQIAAIAGKPNAIGFTDPRRPYENYGNNNNNLIGTIVNQVHELGHSLFSITQTLSPLVPEPQEMGSALENCVRQHHGFVRH